MSACIVFQSWCSGGPKTGSAGPSFGMKNAPSTSSICWGLVLQKDSKILLCVSLEEEEPGPAPGLHHCLLTAPPWSLLPLPSLTSNSSNLIFGAQGGSWRLKPIPPKQEVGTQKGLCPISPLSFFFFFGFLLPHLQHMEVPRLGVELEL